MRMRILWAMISPQNSDKGAATAVQQSRGRFLGRGSAWLPGFSGSPRAPRGPFCPPMSLRVVAPRGLPGTPVETPFIPHGWLLSFESCGPKATFHAPDPFLHLLFHGAG